MTERYRTTGGMKLAVTNQNFLQWMKSSCDGTAAWIDLGAGPWNARHGTTKKMTDIVTPGFHLRRKRGEVFFTPMSSEVRVQGIAQAGGFLIEENAVQCFAPYEYHIRRKLDNAGYLMQSAIGLTEDGEYKIPLVISDSDIRAATYEASTSCLNKRTREKQNLFESSAEVHKSLGLLDGILGNALKVVSRKRKLLERARDAGSAYLAYRYGLKPIMNDIEGIITGLNKAVGKSRRTSRGEVILNGSSSSSSTVSPGGLAVTTVQHDCVEQCVIRATCLDEYVSSLASNIGFSDKGLITLPWELLPYSFVVDWFANVGDYIGALVPLSNVEQLGSCLTVTRSVSYQGRTVGTVANAGQTLITPLTGSSSGSRVVKYRQPGLPAPRIVVRSNFGFDRVLRNADAISLLIQKL